MAGNHLEPVSSAKTGPQERSISDGMQGPGMLAPKPEAGAIYVLCRNTPCIESYRRTRNIVSEITKRVKHQTDLTSATLSGQYMQCPSRRADISFCHRQHMHKMSLSLFVLSL